MTRLYVIRHGETLWNKEKRTQGCSNNLSLSEKGKFQAKCVANKFSCIPVSSIYSSDLNRAYETAVEISKSTSSPIIKTSELRELNFGCWEGMTFVEIEREYKDIFETWRSNPVQASIPGAETLAELQKRVLNATSDIIRKHDGENIVIVSHGITIKVLILSVLGIDLLYHNKLRINNTGVSLIEYTSSGPVLTLYNDTCHLH